MIVGGDRSDGWTFVTPHNEARKGDYAGTVLLPGDPQRAAWIAETFLDAPRCVNARRGALGFTGRYNGQPMSLQATGIGASSFLIYAHELLEYYGAKTLIRIGTCGALRAEVALRSLVISQSVRAEDAASGQVFGLYDAGAGPDPALLALARAKAGELGITHHVGPTISSDVFYHPKGQARFEPAQAAGAIAVDMETSALYRIAAHFGARALSICAVVDNVVTSEETDYAERQELFADMARLALEVAAS
jgi:purine-nucleoside phosphorylase